jgi:molybdopterin-guanine dinucleotide biosynthesis protein A
MARTLGIVLAGGPGARLALGLPKSLVRLGGRTLLERSRAVLAAVCDEVVVAAPAALALPVDAAERVADPVGSEGPLGGLVAGLAARPYERALVLGVDFPLMRPAMLRALAGMLGAGTAVLPLPGGMPQPLAAAYGPEAAGRLAACLAAGERAVMPAVAQLRPLVVRDGILAGLDGGLDCFLNVNAPGDLERAEALLAR